MKPAGNHQAIWDAGRQSSEIYYCRIKAKDMIETEMIVLLR